MFLKEPVSLPEDLASLFEGYKGQPVSLFARTLCRKYRDHGQSHNRFEVSDLSIGTDLNNWQPLNGDCSLQTLTEHVNPFLNWQDSWEVVADCQKSPGARTKIRVRTLPKPEEPLVLDLTQALQIWSRNWASLFPELIQGEPEQDVLEEESEPEDRTEWDRRLSRLSRQWLGLIQGIPRVPNKKRKRFADLGFLGFELLEAQPEEPEECKDPEPLGPEGSKILEEARSLTEVPSRDPVFRAHWTRKWKTLIQEAQKLPRSCPGYLPEAKTCLMLFEKASLAEELSYQERPEPVFRSQKPKAKPKDLSWLPPDLSEHPLKAPEEPKKSPELPKRIRFQPEGLESIEDQIMGQTDWRTKNKKQRASVLTLFDKSLVIPKGWSFEVSQGLTQLYLHGKYREGDFKVPLSRAWHCSWLQPQLISQGFDYYRARFLSQNLEQDREELEMECFEKAMDPETEQDPKQEEEEQPLSLSLSQDHDLPKVPEEALFQNLDLFPLNLKEMPRIKRNRFP